MLVSYCCCNKLPQTQRFIQRQIYYITILEVRSSKWISEAAFLLEILGRTWFLSFSSFHRLPTSLGSWPLPPSSKPAASVASHLSLYFHCHIGFFLFFQVYKFESFIYLFIFKTSFLEYNCFTMVF